METVRYKNYLCISKSENTIILGISHRDDEINAIVNTILTTTKWIIWKERNVAKYQKKTGRA
jgi:hypothetical protein